MYDLVFTDEQLGTKKGRTECCYRMWAYHCALRLTVTQGWLNHRVVNTTETGYLCGGSKSSNQTNELKLCHVLDCTKIPARPLLWVDEIVALVSIHKADIFLRKSLIIRKTNSLVGELWLATCSNFWWEKSRKFRIFRVHRRTNCTNKRERKKVNSEFWCVQVKVNDRRNSFLQLNSTISHLSLKHLIAA